MVTGEPFNNAAPRGGSQSGGWAWLARTGVLAARACRLQCPNCGTRKIFTTWFRMRPVCPTCGLDFERREQGYIVGAYMLNIVGAELLFLLVFIGILVATWPAPPWRLLQVATPILMVVVPLLTYPVSKTLFLAMDLAVRPHGAE